MIANLSAARFGLKHLGVALALFVLTGCPQTTVPTTYELTVTVLGDGSVSPAGGTFTEGEVVEFTATAANGWRFDIWSGDIDDPNATISITVNSDLAITASFVQQFELSISVDGDGEVLADPEGPLYDAETAVNLQAQPAEGWEFERWEGAASGTDSDITLTVRENCELTAVFVAQAPDLVLLDGLVVGAGVALVDPVGEPGSLSGWYYPVGTTVTLSAVADSGWVFVGWGGDIDSVDAVTQVTLSQDTYVFAVFEQITPPAAPVFIGAVLIAADGTFLGNVNQNPFDADGLANPYGTYGNSFSTLSIWNRFGLYGSEFGLYSAYNSFSMSPPELYIDGVFYGYVTKNSFLMGAIDPDDLAMALGRYDVIRG